MSVFMCLLREPETGPLFYYLLIEVNKMVSRVHFSFKP